MIRVLEDQGNTLSRVDPAFLWLHQACDQPEEGALAAAVAAHQHPKTWAGNVQAALI